MRLALFAFVLATLSVFCTAAPISLSGISDFFSSPSDSPHPDAHPGAPVSPLAAAHNAEVAAHLGHLPPDLAAHANPADAHAAAHAAALNHTAAVVANVHASEPSGFIWTAIKKASMATFSIWIPLAMKQPDVARANVEKAKLKWKDVRDHDLRVMEGDWTVWSAMGCGLAALRALEDALDAAKVLEDLHEGGAAPKKNPSNAKPDGGSKDASKDKDGSGAQHASATKDASDSGNDSDKKDAPSIDPKAEAKEKAIEKATEVSLKAEAYARMMVIVAHNAWKLTGRKDAPHLKKPIGMPSEFVKAFNEKPPAATDVAEKAVAASGWGSIVDKLFG